MCGIAGVRRFGPEPITIDQIRFLLCSLESRGTDATGIALVNRDEEIQTVKADVPASQFVTMRNFEKFLEKHLNAETETVLLHTRAATQGDPKVAANNHPLYAGTSAVTHNGVILNDDWLFRDLKLKREAETDSDIIRAMIDKYGMGKDTLKTLNRMSGSCAAAVVSNDEPGKLLLLRSGSPLVLAATEHQLLWASNKEALHLAVRPWKMKFGMHMQANRSDVLFTPVRDQSAWMFGPEGLEYHDRFSSCTRYTTPDYSRVYDNFSDKKERWTNSKKVRCPNDKCGIWLDIPDKFKRTPLYELICTTCKTDLAPHPKAN